MEKLQLQLYDKMILFLLVFNFVQRKNWDLDEVGRGFIQRILVMERMKVMFGDVRDLLENYIRYFNVRVKNC